MVLDVMKKANRLFQEEEYLEALKLYQELDKALEGSFIDISFNINLCKEKIINYNESLIVDKSSKVLTEECENLLKTNISQVYESNLSFDKGLLFNFYEELKCKNIYEVPLEMLLNILLYSPFQLSLLLLIAYRLNKEGYQYIFEDTIEDINLVYLVRCCCDYKFWLDNKDRVIQLMKVLEVPISKKYLNKDFRGMCIKDLSIEEFEKILFDFNKNNFKDYKKDSEFNKKISIGSILLNESKFIGLNLTNHYNLCDEWILVEGACKGYPERKVTSEGLSLDNSAMQIILFPDKLNKLMFIQHGWTLSDGENAKSELRNEYLKRVSGKILWVLDIDEFYSESDIKFIVQKFETEDNLTAYTLPQVHFWKNLSNFIIGGYYDISHTRFFRNIPGIKYISNHNFPEINSITLNRINHSKSKRVIVNVTNETFKYEGPRCYHMGFAKDIDDMHDKTQYYINRGEKATREQTTASRAGWFNDNLPEECRIIKWGGNYPWVLGNLSID